MPTPDDDVPLPRGGLLTLILPVVALVVTGCLALAAIMVLISGQRGWPPWAAIALLVVNVGIVSWQTVAWQDAPYAEFSGWRLVRSILSSWIRGGAPDWDRWEPLEIRQTAVRRDGRQREPLYASGSTKRWRGLPAYLLFLTVFGFTAVVAAVLAFEKNPPRTAELMIAILIALAVAPLLWPLARLPVIGVWRLGDELLIRSTMRTQRVRLSELRLAEPYPINPHSVHDVGMLFASGQAELWCPILRFRDDRKSKRLLVALAARRLNEAQIAQLNGWIGVEFVRPAEPWNRFRSDEE